jgi:hypothetical protein
LAEIVVIWAVDPGFNLGEPPQAVSSTAKIIGKIIREFRNVFVICSAPMSYVGNLRFELPLLLYPKVFSAFRLIILKEIALFRAYAI